jgi:putative hemolysin
MEVKMSRKALFNVLTLISLMLITSCTTGQASPTPEANLPNPASVYCEENGGELRFKEDSSGGIVGICVFPDGSECEEWAFFRGECTPASQGIPTSLPTEIPSPPPIDPADYQGWWTYTHPIYGFSILLPTDWVVDETATGDPLMNGHLLNLHPQNSAENLNIRMTFRNISEEVLLWPTGVGAGEFIHQGSLDVAGQPALRVLFVCPTGQINEVWYHQSENEPNLQRSDMEFGFIFSFTGVYCQEGYSLEGKQLRVGEMIIASLKVP